MRRATLHACLSAACLLTAACAGRPDAVAVVQPPPVLPAPVAQPAFAALPYIAIPPRTADGGYATPNATVSPAGAVWHLRAGLNVAALACRGPDEAALVAGYNAALRTHAAAFDRAYRALAAEHGGAAAFDGAMTRLYNYYALPPAQPGLCAAARALLAEVAQLPPGAIAGYAPAALARLDRPYQAVFAAQDAWAATRLAARAPAAATLPIDPSVHTQP